MKYTITKNNLHIVDSYKVSKTKFEGELAKIKGLHPNSDVWKRSTKSLCKEWATHNLCYAMHLFRSHTKDVDLNYPQKWYEKLGYGIVGAVALLFIS